MKGGVGRRNKWRREETQEREGGLVDDGDGDGDGTRGPMGSTFWSLRGTIGCKWGEA